MAERSSDSWKDDDAMDIDQWRSEDRSVLIEFKDCTTLSLIRQNIVKSKV
jgi:hypothetical protein